MILVLDIGDVLIHTKKNAQYHALAEFTGHPRAKVVEFFELQNLPHLYESGNIGSWELYYLFLDQFDTKLSFEQFSLAWSSVIQTPNHILLRTIQNLNSKYQITLASNIGEIHWNHVKSTFDKWLKNYNWCLSFQVGFSKPKVEFFLHLLEFLETDPAKIFFIDDSRNNIDQAINLGMNGYVHYSTRDTIQFLETF